MKNTGKVSKTSAKPGQQDARKDRKSATGMNGSPKKGGHGGKFTWSGDGYSRAEIGFDGEEDVNVNDPNFEEPEEIVTV